MTDRPIIFSAPMVRALLERRKTQTRRLLNPQPTSECAGFQRVFVAPPYFEALDHAGKPCYPFPDGAGCVSPYPKIRFAVGDRLYVREHWKVDLEFEPFAPSELRELPFFDGDICYLATAPAESLRDPVWGRHRQGMHMPRWASRLTLTVTDVRVQRLGDICEEDARAEGLLWTEPTDEDREWAKSYAEENGGDPSIEGVWTVPGIDCGFGPKPRCPMWGPTPKSCFQFLWDSLHTDKGKRWQDNPWVVAISFDVQHGNIDRIGGAA